VGSTLNGTQWAAGQFSIMNFQIWTFISWKSAVIKKELCIGFVVLRAEQHLLGCDAVKSDRNTSLFQKSVLPLFSGSNSKSSTPPAREK
jgi:hypothetical protein